MLPWHTEIWQQLQQRRKAQNMPHALLLSGPAGVGKAQFADHLSQALVCAATEITRQPCGECQHCHLAQAGSHPDIRHIVPEEEGKAIRVDEIRQLIHKANLTTQNAHWQVFIINPAEAMNAAAANALLKTLEEPTPQTLFILVSANPNRLPATIRSRCQPIPFKPVLQEQALTWLQAQTGEDCTQALAFSGNAPLLALDIHQQNRLIVAQQTLAQLLELKIRQTNPLRIVESWSERPLAALFAELMRICSDILQLANQIQAARLFLPGQQLDLQSLAQNINLSKLYVFIERLNNYNQQMSHNLNPQMLLGKIVIDWLWVTRPEKS
jgi:DNA polymerase-3 subunit delta'